MERVDFGLVPLMKSLVFLGEVLFAHVKGIASFHGILCSHQNTWLVLRRLVMRQPTNVVFTHKDVGGELEKLVLHFGFAFGTYGGVVVWLNFSFWDCKKIDDSYVCNKYHIHI